MKVLNRKREKMMQTETEIFDKIEKLHIFCREIHLYLSNEFTCQMIHYLSPDGEEGSYEKI